MQRLALSLVIFIAMSASAGASVIQNACLKTDRGASQRALCGCVQAVANVTLTERDQRLAATFFADPHRAQEIRQSGTRRNSAFWERYKRFGAVAERRCRR